MWDGDDYPTIMHAFYAARCADRNHRRWIKSCPSPVALDWMIKQVAVRSDWETVKTEVMEEIVRAKFDTGDMRHALLITMDAEIVDNYLPDNIVGKAMMKIREEINSAVG